MDGSELHIKQEPHDECTQLFYHDYENKQHECFEARNTEIPNNYPTTTADALQSHPQQTPYMCLQCGAVYKSLQQLMCHVEIHEKTQATYQCIHCTYTNVNFSEMYVHLKTHSVKRPYEANVRQSCNRKSHSPQRPYLRQTSYELANHSIQPVVQKEEENCITRNGTQSEAHRRQQETQQCSNLQLLPMPLLLLNCSTNKQQSDVACLKVSTTATAPTENASNSIPKEVANPSPAPALQSQKEPCKCNTCHEVFNDVQGVIDHIRNTHMKPVNLKCKQCDKEFSSEQDYRHHIWLTHILTGGASHYLARKKDQHINEAQTKTAIRNQESHPTSKTTLSATVAPTLTVSSSSSNSDKVTLYSCTICQRGFYEMQEVLDHISNTHTADTGHVKKTVAEKPAMKCTNCGKCCQSENAFEYHMKQHDRELHHACTKCDKRFHTRLGLRHHMKTHAGGKLHKCEYCAALFRGYGGLCFHLRAHKTDSVHKCRYCNQVFSFLNGLKCHTRLHTGESSMHGCTLCGRRYLSSGGLKSHMMHFHGNTGWRSSQLPQCPQCDKRFKTRLGLNVHIRSHSLEEPYECHLCAKHFRTAGNLKYHMRVHTDGVREEKEPLGCKHCSKRFMTSAGLKFHTRLHTSKLRHKCTECNKSFRKASDRQRHLLEHKGEYTYKCSICKQRFRGKTGFELHTEVHVNDKEKLHVCLHCGKRFNRKSRLDAHVQIIHIREFNHHCNECDRKFTTKQGLANHMPVHTGEKPHECIKKCGRRFMNLMSMHRHVKRFHSAPQKCPYCNKEFLACSLKVHIRNHTGERPFVCDYPNCDRTFKTRRCLVKHWEIHSGERPYKCSQCGKQWRYRKSFKAHLQGKDCVPFANQAGYSSHVRSNICGRGKSKERRVQCNQCGKGFDTNRALNVHMNIHTKPYKCEHCGEGWSAKYPHARNCTAEKRHHSAQDIPDHVRQSTSHMEERYLKCTECDKKFYKESCLEQHVKTHSTEELFECKRCGRKWDNEAYYRTHLRKKNCTNGKQKTFPDPPHMVTRSRALNSR